MSGAPYAEQMSVEAHKIPSRNLPASRRGSSVLADGCLGSMFCLRFLDMSCISKHLLLEIYV